MFTLRLISRYLIIVLAIAVVGYAAMYFNFKPINFVASKPVELINSGIWRTCFYLHLAGGSVALLIGPFQFIDRFRNRYRATHRFLGKTYVIAILISGLAGVYLALFASTGLVASLGFAGLAIAWLFTTGQAYRWAHRRKWNVHKVWMIRSFAITLAAVTLRIYLPLFLVGFQLPFSTAYPIIAWLCWVPNLFVAEALIRRDAV
ncbi:MAG: DUF2306 domain-containing protein [Cytophagaceae bacterium]|nr:DUF2306 domain-containing protein [Cytophagaceae bacterium]